MTQETIDKILKFRDDRDWKQFHNVACMDKKDKIAEELADVVNYCVLMADACGLDLDEIVQKKIAVNNEKYPVNKAKGKSDKYSEL